MKHPKHLAAKLLAGVAAAAALTGCVLGDFPIEAQQLPQAARDFIGQHFDNREISFAKVDRELLDTDYKAVLVNGDKIKFNGRGQWVEIDCSYSHVPQQVIPAEINSQIEKRFPGAAVLEIKRLLRRYEVELDNGLELLFDAGYRLVEIDD